MALKKKLRSKSSAKIEAVRCKVCDSPLYLEDMYTAGMTKCRCGGVILSRHDGKNEVFSRKESEWESIPLEDVPKGTG